MYFDPKSTYSESSNIHLSLNEEESEVLRLQTMLRENILKVERENMEAIKKGILNEKVELETKNNVNSVPEKVPKITVNKSSVSLKKGPISLHAKSPQAKKNLNMKSNMHTEAVPQTVTASCPFSNVHFLNHFQSSYLSSKPPSRIQTWNEVENSTFLNPPSDTQHVPVQFSKRGQSDKTAVYNKKETHKTLTVQALPSITINGEQANFKRNILMEEMKEKSHSFETYIKTKMLPTVSKENKVSWKVKQGQESCVNDGLKKECSKGDYTEKGIQCNEQLTRSVYTQSSHDSKEVTVNKEYLKEIVREVLEDFKLESYKGLHTSSEGGPITIPHKNDCELDSFIGNATSNLCDEDCLQKKDITQHSILTQTSSDTQIIGFDKAQMKDLMKEIIHEYNQVASLLHLPENKQEKCVSPPAEMVHRGTQTDEQSCHVSLGIPKEVQVNLLQDKPICDHASNNLSSPIATCNTKGDTSVIAESNLENTLNQPNIPNPLSPSTVFAPEISTRLEFVINSIYEHFCKGTSEPYVTSSKLSEPQRPITTTDTSVQLDSIPMSNKATCTNHITHAHSASQSDPPMTEKKTLIHASIQSDPPIIEKKTLIHASVQSDPLPPISTPPREQVDSSTQCIRIASRDASIQTFEGFHSEGSSVSSTPVSDSMFLDDMLSEGEVCLPWNLRLLSHSDKSQLQSSSNIATEDSCTSDKEKDYSLSEGEIPPNYFQQMSLVSNPYDSGSDSSHTAQHQRATVLCQKSPLRTNPLRTSIRIPLQSQSSNSSLSEGEVRNASTLSEGQIFTYSKPCFPKQPRNFIDSAESSVKQDKLTQQSFMSSQVSECLDSSFGLGKAIHSGSNVSEGEIIIRPTECGFVNAPHGLFTLREEK